MESFVTQELTTKSTALFLYLQTDQNLLTYRTQCAEIWVDSFNQLVCQPL